MKQSKRILALVLSVLFALTLLPLSTGAAVKIAPPKQTTYVDIGGTTQLTITVSGGKKPASLPITYASNNTSIAKIDATGMITGVAKGQTSVTATYEKQMISIPVYVTEALQPYSYGRIFEIDYPKSWKSHDPEGNFAGMFTSAQTAPSDTYAENVFVYVVRHTFATPRKFAADWVSQSSSAQSFKLVSTSDTKLAGMNAIQLICTFIDDRGVACKTQTIFAVSNSYDFLIAYYGEAASYDLFTIEAKRIIDSFRLIK